MARPISRPDRQPLECDQEQDGAGHQTNSTAYFLRPVWDKVTQQQCRKLVDSMPRHMKAVIAYQDYSTKFRFLNILNISSLLNINFSNYLGSENMIVFFTIYQERVNKMIKSSI